MPIGAVNTVVFREGLTTGLSEIGTSVRRWTIPCTELIGSRFSEVVQGIGECRSVSPAEA
ncbi:MAG TPA: hypothetical protein VFG15_21785 [Amycolatopsis sp.]|nr:hypothetical protein [Amycolatopsis sp.]